jgi:hypothetical protein
VVTVQVVSKVPLSDVSVLTLLISSASSIQTVYWSSGWNVRAVADVSASNRRPHNPSTISDASEMTSLMTSLSATVVMF